MVTFVETKQQRAKRAQMYDAQERASDYGLGRPGGTAGLTKPRAPPVRGNAAKLRRLRKQHPDLHALCMSGEITVDGAATTRPNSSPRGASRQRLSTIWPMFLETKVPCAGATAIRASVGGVREGTRPRTPGYKCGASQLGEAPINERPTDLGSRAQRNQPRRLRQSCRPKSRLDQKIRPHNCRRTRGTWPHRRGEDAAGAVWGHGPG
jgi:hypothetical protein